MQVVLITSLCLHIAIIELIPYHWLVTYNEAKT